jgi:hypothetical protein
MAGVIHVSSRAAQPSITAGKAAFTVARNRRVRRVRASRRETCRASRGSTARGSGDHHSSVCSSYGHGKMPAR